MDARFYNSEEIDIERLANDLENMYRIQGYQVQQIGGGNQVMVQLKKGGDLEALIGLQAALSVILQRTSGGVVAMIGQQKWIDKAAVGAVGLVAAPVLWPLMITAGAGAIRQASLGNQVLNAVDSLIHQQYPNVRLGPVPVQIMPMIQQQWAPPPPQYLPPPQAPQYVPPASNVVNALPATPAKLRCPSCNTPYEEGDTFCSGCGKSLKTLCPNCKAEIKPGLAFCPKCGASTFQASSPSQATILPSTPAPAPTIPAYTPPAQPQPPVQQKPPVPVYTPPAQPPKPAPQPQAQPQPYVPPTPQEPPVMPKPTITMIPGSAKPETPPAPQPPRKPSVPVYTPPVQPQPVQPAATTIQTNVSPSSQTIPARKPILPKPANQPAFDPNAVWGALTFSDGKEIRLSGERAMVGRADHDIGDLDPEVDLSTMQGSDTVSRIHATIEHIGSTYTLTDLNSTNSTRVNGKRLEPDKPTPIKDGDTLQFGKVACTFKKA
ncbi:MAG TPA: FHA domain-containing protein [Ktedonobacteraceae bacterium]|jgi:hypothetical protein|nr:FHA domain-containing protein [Ktedonobacteraceae bacterium]